MAVKIDKYKKELLHIREVSDLLGVHIDTLRRWDRSGRLKSIRLNGKGPRRYKSNVIKKLIKES